MEAKKTINKEKVLKLVKLFKDEFGNEIKLSPTQEELFLAIVLKKYKRVGVITPSQYGKSLTTALSVLLRTITLPEKWVIIGGTKSKAEIIMGYIIDHIFDNPIFYSQLLVDTSLERLKRERRKDHLTFRSGGEIMILSAEYRNRKRIGEALIGHGAQNIVLDDSCLCDDDQYAFIKRMLGGRKDTFMLELSNPLRKNHFYKTITSDRRYHKIWIDWRVAVEEGRFTQDFVDEMRELPFFKQLYECRFPDDTEIDDKGYMKLLTDEEIEKAIAPVEFDLENEKILGVDIARGGNYNVFCIRQGNKAKIVSKDRNPDLMVTTGKIIQIMREHNIKPCNVYIDDTGVGGGVVARLKEQHYSVNGVNFGSNAKEQYAKNLRAELYWKLREWIKNNGCIEQDERLIEQLKLIKYKTDSSGKIQIQPKEEMIIYGYDSPDEADALALTFACQKTITLADFDIYTDSNLQSIAI